MILRLVCSWCSTLVREGSPNAPTSHTLCLTCAAKLHAELDAKGAA
jgi:hypothetical protein